MAAPKLIFASDSFKGTLSSERTAELLAQATSELLPDATFFAIPMADGGEGTEEALVSACGGTHYDVVVHRDFVPAQGPVGDSPARLGILPSGDAVIEIASAAGLARFGVANQLPDATTYGVGELIRAALDTDCERITLTLGGSRTNDGGIGMAYALGARFLDANGAELAPLARNLGRICRIDLSGLDPRLAHIRFTAMCDVNNPLTGPQGATYTFGPQKMGCEDPGSHTNAYPWDVLDELEAGMCVYERVLATTFGASITTTPGAGAAGGLGAACLAFLGAELKPGIDVVLDLVGFEELVACADLVITGEGRLDAQTAHGKVVCGIASRCAAHDVPCVAIAGSVEPGAEELTGLTAAMPVALGPCTLQECLERADDLYLRAARRTLALYAAGIRRGQ